MTLTIRQAYDGLELDVSSMEKAVEIFEMLAPCCKAETVFNFNAVVKAKGEESE